MKKKTNIRLVVTALCFAVVLALSGCMSAPNAANEEQTANREYMSQVNLIMDDLYAGLQDFSEAVSKSDIVGMRTQADAAFKAIDDLGKMTPPENLKDLQAEYVKGCESLKSALSDYIDLYAEIDTATEDQPFDYSTYEGQLEKIKKAYNGGIDRLEAADKKATEI